MKITRGYKTELDLNDRQRAVCVKHAGAARFAYNWGLKRKIDAYAAGEKSPSAIDLHRELNALKKGELAWLYEVSKCAPQEALRDLDKAYQHFFRRVKQGKEPGEKPGFPQFKSRKRGLGSFRLTGAIHVTETHVRLPRLGWLSLKEHGYIPTEGMHILSATVSEAAGHWFVSVQCTEEIAETAASGEPVGVDLGIKTLAVVSDGREFANPKALRKAQKQLARRQRELARRQPGGRNRAKTRAKIARLHYRIANIRRDALHQATAAITARNKPESQRPCAIVLEDLNVNGMVKNHRLAQAIADVGMGEFRRQVEYKAQWLGERVVIADRFFPSSRRCSVCGAINAELTLNERVWTCDCGVVHDRDLNAARNLAQLATTVSSTGSYACGEDVSPVLNRQTSLKQEPNRSLGSA